jgi:hypothetical protein
MKGGEELGLGAVGAENEPSFLRARFNVDANCLCSLNKKKSNLLYLLKEGCLGYLSRLASCKRGG